jgi:phosphatidylglycerol:prolipoprotein diacylglycerol transferase
MAPYLSIFGFSIQAYPLFLLIAVMAGLWLAARQARRLGLDADHVYNLGFYTLLATLVGARLAFVIGNWSAYRDAPLSALSPTTTAFAWPEGAVVGAIVAVIYWLRYRLPVGLTLDAIAPGLALAMAIERLGAFLGGVNFGEPTGLPWGVFMWGEVRHPRRLHVRPLRGAVRRLAPPAGGLSRRHGADLRRPASGTGDRAGSFAGRRLVPIPPPLLGRIRHLISLCQPKG